MFGRFTSHFNPRAAHGARWLLPLSLAASSAWLGAHGFSAGDVRVEHPFATPAAVASNGTAYLKNLRNVGGRSERLIGASTPVATLVELQSEAVDAIDAIDAQGGRRMQSVPEVVLPPGSDLKMRPGKGPRLQLVGLRQALRDGDTFPMTLQFERGGMVEVKVYVQTPR